MTNQTVAYFKLSFALSTVLQYASITLTISVLSKKKIGLIFMYHAEVKEKSYYGGGFCPMQRSQYSSCSSSRVKLQKEDKILQLLSPPLSFS